MCSKSDSIKESVYDGSELYTSEETGSYSVNDGKEAALQVFANAFKLFNNGITESEFQMDEELDTETFTARYLVDITTLAEQKSSSIIIITAAPIWVQLQRQGMAIDLELPTEEELFNIIVENIRPYQNQIKIIKL